MSWLIFIAAFLITIIAIVGFHEAAHFLAARLVGVKVLRFSIGFGKTLFSFHDKRGTEYVLALIPLGGYVKMLGETDEIVDEREKCLTYLAQPFYKKAFIIAAGPFANFVFAFLLYTAVYCIGFTTLKPILGKIAPHSIAAAAKLPSYHEITAIDGVNTPSWTKIVFQLLLHTGNKDTIVIETTKVCGLAETRSATCQKKSETHQLNLATWVLEGLNPDPLSSLGIEPYFPFVPLTIGQVATNSVAEKIGFRVNDHLVKLNHMPIQSWEQLAGDILKKSSSPLLFEILRNNKPMTLTAVIPSATGWFKQTPRLGIAPKTIAIPDVMLKKVNYGPTDAIYHAYLQCKELTYFNLIVLGKMISGKLSLDGLGGPIAIFDTAGQALNQGMIVFLVFLAFMNLSIGLINLLPIPGLDGGHLLLQFIECIIRRPVPLKITEWMLRGGFIILFLIFLRALLNDVLRLF